MRSNFMVEAEKLLRRPANWMLCGILVASMLLFVYLLVFVLAFGVEDGGVALLSDLEPASIPSNAMSQFGTIGVPIALTLGAIAMGSEYRWDTVKRSVVVPTGRAGFVLGKFLALGAFTAIMCAVVLLSGFIFSLAAILLLNVSTRMPSLTAVFGVLGAGWLILVLYAALGLFLGVVLRSSGGAIAVGFMYVLVVEPILSGIIASNNSFKWVAAGFPGHAIGELELAVRETPKQPALGFSSPVSAVFLPLIWMFFLTLFSLLIFSRRDIG